ncbi:hypothetical protein Tco_0940284 [Tanacetum coccineum]|uniref:Reverse transcriptase Ty1/copia-type domain-containing protein n=1 Tax=Tanacetum coccineum TaxID=301880 RepID=A0ABQ5DUA4_9ASTR
MKKFLKAVESLFPLLVQKSHKLTSTPTWKTAFPSGSTTWFPRQGGLRYSQPPSISNAVSSKNIVEDFFGDSTHATTLNEVEADLSNMETTISQTFLSQEEPKKISEALKDSSWVEVMQEELLQFQINYERRNIIKKQGQLWLRGHTQEEGIDYEEVFAPVAKIEAIRSVFDEAASVFKILVSTRKVYKEAKASMRTQSKYMFNNGFQRDDIIFGLSNPKLCRELEALMHDKFKMSAMGELSFFLDLRSANTPMDRENPWGKDGTGKDVDLHLYRSMIGSLMYLTAQRPIRCLLYLKGHPKIELWYPKESRFDLVAYSIVIMVVPSQDRKSATGECQTREEVNLLALRQSMVAL